MEQSAAKNGIQAYFFCLSDDSNYLIAWAKAGLGLAVIPESAEAIARHEGLACVRMDDPELTTTAAVVWGASIITRRQHVILSVLYRSILNSAKSSAECC